MAAKFSLFVVVLVCIVASVHCGCENEGGWFQKLRCSVTNTANEVKQNIEDGIKKIESDCGSSSGVLDVVGCGFKSGAEHVKDVAGTAIKNMDDGDSMIIKKIRDYVERK